VLNTGLFPFAIVVAPIFKIAPAATPIVMPTVAVLVIEPLSVFVPLAAKMPPVLFIPVGVAAPVGAMFTLFVNVTPLRYRAAPAVAAVGNEISPVPNALPFVTSKIPPTIVTAPFQPLLLADTTNRPKSFFCNAFVAALNVNGVSNVATVPAVTSIPTVAAFRLIVRPVSV
jgi:hypothetical protein